MDELQRRVLAAGNGRGRTAERSGADLRGTGRREAAGNGRRRSSGEEQRGGQVVWWWGRLAMGNPSEPSGRVGR